MKGTLNGSRSSATIDEVKASLAKVRYTLEKYIQNKNGQQPETPTLTEPLDSGCATLEHLCQEFELSHFERDILLLCVGMEVEVDFEFLCADAQGNPERNYPTLSLALTVFPNADWNVLSASSPLQHWQLIEFEEGSRFTQRPLQIDKRILCYILGEPSYDEKLAGILKPLVPRASFTLPPSALHLVSAIAKLFLSNSSQSATCCKGLKLIEGWLS